MTTDVYAMTSMFTNLKKGNFGMKVPNFHIYAMTSMYDIDDNRRLCNDIDVIHCINMKISA